MIYFDKNKKAYAFEIENPICAIDEALWSNYAGSDRWDIVDGKFVDITDTEEYQTKQAQVERERIARLSLTKREVFLGLYQAKGVTPDEIKEKITDPMALIEFEYANDYFRGNPLIDSIGGIFGITPEQLDNFFEDGNYEHLLV